MNIPRALAIVVSSLAPVAVVPSLFATSTPGVGDLRKSGTVHFDVTCNPEVKNEFQTAVALLHSFFYDEARRRFLEIARRDPECAMAWWGVGMTWYHPLWAPPTAEEMTAGAEAAQKATSIGGATELERGFISAMAAFYRTEEDPGAAGPVEQSCHGPRSHGARAAAYGREMEALYQRHPDNLEVAVFYTLSLLGTASPTDKTYANQLKATAILEPLFKAHPDHPGIAHYIIHAYDYPALADRALEAARHYGEIAPWVPHALHMPTHIYTRLGMWEDSIAGNLASGNAAREYTARLYGGGSWYDELHALDYAMYAYLQTAQDRKAAGVRDYVRDIRKFVEPNFAAAYAVGAIPARYLLERRRWTEAAALEPFHPELLARFPFARAHVEFARAVGAARSGELAVAQASVQQLAELRDALADANLEWWINQIEIQRLAAAGWLAHAESKDGDALDLLRRCAALEDRAGTHPVTPGQILPAHEQLGDLLLELHQPGRALVDYEKSLEAFPNRFNSHFGAARAAEQVGRRDVALRHYRHLLAMARMAESSGDTLREELRLAHNFVGE